MGRQSGQFGRWRKVCGGKDLPKSQVLSSEWKNERVREDESGDSEDGEDELPCVIGGEREADSIWRGCHVPADCWKVCQLEHGTYGSNFGKVSDMSFQLDWPTKLFFAHGVACGMEYLHSIRPYPIIHGQLKLQNVLVGDGLVAKVCVVVTVHNLCNCVCVV